jgi:hypothetical protein
MPDAGTVAQSGRSSYPSLRRSSPSLNTPQAFKPRICPSNSTLLPLEIASQTTPEKVRGIRWITSTNSCESTQISHETGRDGTRRRTRDKIREIDN